MKRIIIYGYGRKFHKLHPTLRDCEIVAIADKSAELLTTEDIENVDVPIISPKDINNYQYDYVAISVFGVFEHIKQQLIGENGVSAEKIISLMLFSSDNDCYVDVNGRTTQLDYDTANAIETLQKLFRSRDGYEHNIVTFYKCPENELDGRRYVLPNALIFDTDDKTDCDERIHLAKTSDDTQIYVVTHAPYHVLEGGIYSPITVGEYHVDGFITEQDDDNIAHLNDKINENTAIYWMWKNSDADIIGVNHYRRYFYNNELRCRENRLDAKTIERILKLDDIIVYRGIVPRGETVEEEMRQDLPDDVFDYGYNVITDNIKKYQPDYLNDFYAVMQSNNCCYCNMFVMKKELLNEYCGWLFSFLIPAAEQADVSKYNSHDKRIIGFFAERMLSVWLHHNHLHECALPVYIPQ